MAFVNRRSELADLETWWARTHPRPAMVWGRRRVGKTALLQRFASDKRSIFHLGTGRPERGEVAQLSRKVHQIAPSRVRNLAESPFQSWEEALEYLDAAAREAPLLLVFDEFPEMMSKSPELPGILRAFVDTTGPESGLRILLCGSAMRTMEAIQEYRAPLYGRFDLSMQLHPFRPHEAAEMLPALNPADRALAYGLLGGMPLYLSWWDAGESVRENISRLACRPTAPMLVEGDYLLATEARHGDQLADVLRAIAEGRTKHQEISDAIGADPSRTLRELQRLRLIERLMPVTETEKSRRRIYQITDNFLAFYLRVLGRYRSEIDRGLGDTVLNAVTHGIDDHMGPVWETAFRDHLRRYAAQIHAETVAVGPWWREGRDEIDAVVLAGRSRTPVMVGEAKWARKVDARRLLPRLVQKSAALGVEAEALRFAICARETVTGAGEGTLTVTAADIFTQDTGQERLSR
ncbi:ATP-binding protein [Glycomyces sp. YM15]|uniref:ATP-binding protein n=1 Tax=Glycomyces sp. YM15 TaxID=2800446 RepID=UPI001962E932|nr:ATP-binding protein [Glycomyces sp. YM15]